MVIVQDRSSNRAVTSRQAMHQLNERAKQLASALLMENYPVSIVGHILEPDKVRGRIAFRLRGSELTGETIYAPDEMKRCIQDKCVLSRIRHIHLEVVTYRTCTIEKYTVTLKDNTLLLFANLCADEAIQNSARERVGQENYSKLVRKYCRASRYKNLT